VFEQAKVNNEVWLPVYQEVHAAGRFLLFKLKANEIERYTDCKKFHAESKITIVQE
jgi:head-tail adaptor